MKQIPGIWPMILTQGLTGYRWLSDKFFENFPIFWFLFKMKIVKFLAKISFLRSWPSFDPTTSIWLLLSFDGQFDGQPKLQTFRDSTSKTAQIGTEWTFFFKFTTIVIDYFTTHFLLNTFFVNFAFSELFFFFRIF